MKIAMILRDHAGRLRFPGRNVAPTRRRFEYVLKEEVAAWNLGDADAYSQHFATDGTFTNLLGMFL